jgi:DNA primase
MEYLDNRNIHYDSGGKNISHSGSWVGTQCPFCDDQSNHLGINLDSKAISCWRCSNTKGKSIRDYIHEIEKCSWPQVDNILAQFQNTDKFSTGLPTDEPIKPLYTPGEILPPEATKHFSPLHISFLQSRGFGPETTINKYNLYATSIAGDFKFRIIIPITMDNKLVSYVGRDITGRSGLPYKNCPEGKSPLSVKDCIYNIDTVKDTAVAVEGILDVWRVGDGTICIFGTMFTSKQLRMMHGIKKLFVLFDSDANDWGMHFAYQVTNVVPEIVLLQLSEGDPCELNEEGVKKLREEVFK